MAPTKRARQQPCGQDTRRAPPRQLTTAPRAPRGTLQQFKSPLPPTPPRVKSRQTLLPKGCLAGRPPSAEPHAQEVERRREVLRTCAAIGTTHWQDPPAVQTVGVIQHLLVVPAPREPPDEGLETRGAAAGTPEDKASPTAAPRPLQPRGACCGAVFSKLVPLPHAGLQHHRRAPPGLQPAPRLQTEHTEVQLSSGSALTLRPQRGQPGAHAALNEQSLRV
jgi:hypothetical protein